MAKKRGRRKRRMKKAEPVPLTLTFDMGNEASTKYIDLGEVTSIMSRKLQNQGRNYYVAGYTVLAADIDPSLAGSSVVKLSTLPNSWVVHNSHTKARALWREMRQLVLRDNPSVAGKWSDFKVLMDVGHANTIAWDAGTGRWSTNLYPEDSAAAVALTTYRDWEYAEVVMPQHDVDPATGFPDAALEYSLHMLGSDVAAGSSYVDGSFGVIEGYENSRAVVQVAPDVPAALDTTWMTLLTDEGSQEPELTQQIEDENDQPPYNRTNFPGSAGNMSSPIVAAVAACSAANPVSHGAGFVAPCGLIKVEFDGPVATKLFIHLAPGPHKGYLAPWMGQ